MADKFDIIDYVANALTGYTFNRKQVEYIVMGRGLSDVNDLGQLTQRDKDLLTADLLRIIYTTPSQTGSYTKSHGDYTNSEGAQTITDKAFVRDWMMGLYKKYGENPFPEEIEGGLSWINEYD